MTATPTRNAPQPLGPADAARLAGLLESDFGRVPGGSFRHHYLLDALDRGEWARFVAWPAERPVGVLYLGGTGTFVPAGDPSAGLPLAPVAERAGWRILVGDEAIGRALLVALPKTVFRKRPRSRVQRLMVATPATVPHAAPVVPGFRRAARPDLERITDMACRLHVEDRMGAPLVGPARRAVWDRMADAVARGTSWVVERDGIAVAKVDLSLRSTRRGAQIAGVYVDAAWRGQGLAAGAVGRLTRDLLAEDLPVVSLHVREDNVPAIRAYERAGYVDDGPWLLALR